MFCLNISIQRLIYFGDALFSSILRVIINIKNKHNLLLCESFLFL